MKNLFIALAAIIALASCKKENVSNPATGSKTLSKTSYVYNGNTPETEEFTFGANGKIVSIKENDRTHTFNFVSATSLEVTERSNSNNSILNTRHCVLNDKGFVTQIVVKNANGTISGTYDYTYNAEGYQTGRQLTFPNGDIYNNEYSYADGNLISSKTYKNNVLNSYTNITYDNTKANKTRLNFWSSYWNVPGLFGKETKYLMSETKGYNNSNTLTSHDQYTYELDADGYPLKETRNYVLTGKLGVKSYTFIQ